MFLYSSREPSELSQWLCYDDSTINIVIIIIIIIIIIDILAKGWCRHLASCYICLPLIGAVLDYAVCYQCMHVCMYVRNV